MAKKTAKNFVKNSRKGKFKKYRVTSKRPKGYDVYGPLSPAVNAGLNVMLAGIKKEKRKRK